MYIRSIPLITLTGGGDGEDSTGSAVSTLSLCNLRIEGLVKRVVVEFVSGLGLLSIIQAMFV